MTIYRCGSIFNMTYLCLCQSYELEKTRFKKKYFHPYFKRKFKLKTSRKISESTLQKYPTTCWNWNKMNYKINPHTCLSRANENLMNVYTYVIKRCCFNLWSGVRIYGRLHFSRWRSWQYHAISLSFLQWRLENASQSTLEILELLTN